MTPTQPAALQDDPDDGAGVLVLRESRELLRSPEPRPPALSGRPAVAADPDPVATALTPLLAAVEAKLPGAAALSTRLLVAPPPQLTWGLTSLALAASVGWVYERRRRIELERGVDSALWPTVLGVTTVKNSRRSAGDTVRNTSQSGEALPSIQVFGISETVSRREATLVDLHLLLGELARHRAKRQITAAADLVEGHLVDFRYTSPWVFLELRELYQQLDQREEWELARGAFRARFGQNAPRWSAPSTEHDELANDAQLSGELVRKWPRREARMFVLRWMLGDAVSRQKNFGPPQLPLGIYRDLMWLDSLLDEVLTTTRVEPAGVAA